MLCHDLKTSATFLITENRNAKAGIEGIVKGARLEPGDIPARLLNPTTFLPFIRRETRDRIKSEAEPQAFHDIYDTLRGEDSLAIVSFVPAAHETLNSVREKLEHELSSKEVRLNKPLSDSFGWSSGSTQSDLYYESGERNLLLSLVNTINEAMSDNKVAYTVSITISKPSERIMHYIRARALLLEKLNPESDDIMSLYREARNFQSIPISRKCASSLLNFSDRIQRKRAIPTLLQDSAGDITIGTYVEGSVYDTFESIRMPAQNLNLGLMVAGLPGTGKSFAAMGILKQLLSVKKPLSVVISPTSEWNALCDGLGMAVIDLYHSELRFNFFRCAAGISTERFYENLAMLMASASGAGPYRGPMEKCLLSAFRKIYQETRDPDPTEVYNAIEEAVIERHAKRSNTGVKYTKHGENIIAGLESLRLMLFKRQFAYSGGEDFGLLLKRGVVFDLSSASNNMKPFFYALILNQVYSLADSFDIMGDESIRMAIFIEEAQLIFENTEQSAASADLRQRIQDFRKKGICLALLTHSVNDISVSIRRLCQTKLYFRQGADSVRYAVADLVFSQALHDDIADRLKTLEQRICAVSYMTVCNGSKEPANPIFIKSLHLEMPAYRGSSVTDYKPSKPVTLIRLQDKEGKAVANQKIELTYVGERMSSLYTDANGEASVTGLLKDRPYRVAVVGAKKKDTKVFTILGSKKNEITLE